MASPPQAGWLTCILAGLLALATLSASAVEPARPTDVFRGTNIWTVHLRFTPEQWAAVNAQADAIYQDFTKKVADGRKLPLSKVQDIARGRVWSGADANARGLVDQLGGFWTAVDLAKKQAKIAASESVTFERYPRHKSIFDAADDFFGGPSDEVSAIARFTALMNSPFVRDAATAVKSMPRADVELRATNLPMD